MLRKLVLWGILLAIIGAAVYGWLSYAVIALYEPETPKVTYMFVVAKPERDIEFFYNHIDKSEVEKEVTRLRNTNQRVPWHLDYNWVLNNSVYQMTFDNRFLGKAQ